MRTHSDVITMSAEIAVQRCESSKSYRLPSIIKSFLGIGQLTVSALRIVSLYFNQSCPLLQKGLQIAKWYWLAFIRRSEWLCRIQGSDLLCVHVCTVHGFFCVSVKLFKFAASTCKDVGCVITTSQWQDVLQDDLAKPFLSLNAAANVGNATEWAQQYVHGLIFGFKSRMHN